jgi:hypothetical protein
MVWVVQPIDVRILFAVKLARKPFTLQFLSMLHCWHANAMPASQADISTADCSILAAMHIDRGCMNSRHRKIASWANWLASLCAHASCRR